MGQEQPAQEPTRPHGGPEAPQQGPLGYEALLSQYGKAMLRIGQLEAQMGHLTSLLQGGAAQESQESGTRVEAEASPSTSAGTPVTESAFANPKAGGAVRTPHDEELQQMRLQITNLANQLAETEAESLGSQGRRSRHRRRDHRPWWKKLGRRLGLRESQRP